MSLRFTGFADRTEAGRRLAEKLKARNAPSPVVLALPRGGVPVGYEIARALGAPLDLVLVRKIGVPYQPELALAAVVDGDEPEVVVNEQVAAMTGLDRGFLDKEVQRQLKEIERRRAFYLQGRPQVPVEGRTVILVDDGIATGASMRAALHALRRRKPRDLVVAVPVAPAESVAALRQEADDVVVLATPEPFVAIGLHYADFHQLSDDEVRDLLARADAAMAEAEEPRK
jgi:putative phosphoribosyl transferase